MERDCEIENCGRHSCQPEPYPPLCAKHYMAAVVRAETDARKKFQAEIKAKLRAKGIEGEFFK